MPSFEDAVVGLAERLRRAGLDCSIGEVLDASRSLTVIDVGDRTLVRECLRASLVKEADPGRVFDRCFDAVFRRAAAPADPDEGSPAAPLAADAPYGPSVGGFDAALLDALLDGDDSALGALADQAVAALVGDDDASERKLMHRVMRAMDLSRMLSAAMQQLRRDTDLDEWELTLARNEIRRRLEAFRRALAAEIAARLADRDLEPVAAAGTRPEDADLLHLSRAETEELQRLLAPLLRRLAAKIGKRRKLRSTGRLDVRRTVRRSLQSGGVPIDVVTKRRHPHRPDVVVLCDVSGSVAESAQFTFTLINALHAELRAVRSFAFVCGCAEVSDVFREARFDIAVNRLVERRGVVGLDGHSDYGAAFTHFQRDYVDEVIGNGTTLIVSGDARGNYRDGAPEQFARIAERARRVYWLNPEPCAEWGREDSLIELYRPSCTAVKEVRSLRQLADVIADLV